MKVIKTKSKKVVVDTGSIKPGTCFMGKFPIAKYDGSKLVDAGIGGKQSEGKVYMMVFTPGLGSCLVDLETGVGVSIHVPGSASYLRIEDYHTVEMEAVEVK